MERIFEEDDVAGQEVLPRLKELCLWELGKLKSICSGDLPALEKLRIQGCPLLQKLPLLASIDNNLNFVVIGGEKEWQENLKWGERPTHLPACETQSSPSFQIEVIIVNLDCIISVLSLFCIFHRKWDLLFYCIRILLFVTSDKMYLGLLYVSMWI